MIEDKTKLENEGNFINLLLRYKAFVEEWVSNGPEIETFDEQYHPILHSICKAFSEGAILTRLRFLDLLKSGLFSKIDIISQEALYNRIYINVDNVKKDDFSHLRSKIIESYVKENVVSYMASYKSNMEKGGGVFAAQKLAGQLSGLVSDSESSKQAIYENIEDYHPQYITELEEKAKRGDQDIVTCGIAEIDHCMLVGFAPGTLTLFCGDVASGKSTMMANVAINIWKIKDKNVLIIPLEMPRDKWYQRMISRETGVPFKKIERASTLTDDEWTKLRAADSSFKDKKGKFYIMEAPERISVSYLRREINRHIEIFKPDIIVVDYIANLVPEAKSNMNRNDLQIGEMLKDLRQMGKPGGSGLHKNGFAIISGAQIGREGLKRNRKLGANKSGFFSEDLRGSHEYSADSDNVFAQQPDPNNPESFFLHKIKIRYGEGLFPNGKTCTKLRYKADIGLITGESNLINEMKQDEILKKLDDPVIGFDPLADTGDSDIEVPWEEEKESVVESKPPVNNEEDIEKTIDKDGDDMSWLEE